MDEILKCAVCFSDYDTESHKPCMGKCGHSICVICAKNERCEDCPVCRKDGSFQEIMVNFGLMNIIELKNKKKEEVEGTCSLCKKETTELAICIDCSLKNGIMRKNDSEAQNKEVFGVKWNTESLSLDECIQQATLSLFCADCSIGAVHCGHRVGAFKKIQQTILSNGMSGKKEEIQGFLNSFDQLQKQENQKLDEYRNSISSLLDYVAQSTFDQFNNYSKRISEFIKKSKVLSKELISCHQNIISSIDDIEKKLEANAQSNRTTEIEEIIYHLEYIHNNDGEPGNLEIYAYNTISNTMKMETELSVPYFCASIVHENNVYIIGGFNGVFKLKTVEVYNLNETTWRTLANLNEARALPSVCMHNGKIIVYGGYNDDGFVNSLEEYDFDKNEWKIIGRLDGHSNNRIVSHGNDLYCVFTNEDDPITIKKFNKKMSVFEEVHRTSSVLLPRIRYCTSFYGKIFIIGWKYYLHYNPSTSEFGGGVFETEKSLDFKLYPLNNLLYLIDWKSVELLDEKNNTWNELWRKQ